MKTFRKITELLTIIIFLLFIFGYCSLYFIFHNISLKDFINGLLFAVLMLAVSIYIYFHGTIKFKDVIAGKISKEKNVPAIILSGLMGFYFMYMALFNELNRTTKIISMIGSIFLLLYMISEIFSKNDKNR